jgi:hypothetical protein
MRVSKSLYMLSIIGAPILAIILLVVAVIEMAVSPLEAGLPALSLALVIAIALFIYAVVMGCVLLYKAWKVIQDGHARTSPGKAVGFLFIPFFQLYWIFQAYWGFAKDYNAYVLRHHDVSQGGISIPAVSANLFLSYCILSLVVGFLSWIPLLGAISEIALFVLFILVINAQCNAINNLPAYSGITKAPGTS